MQGRRQWQGYQSLSRPLTILGVERRCFILSLTFAAALGQATASLLAAGLAAGLVLLAGRWAWARDPHLLDIVRKSASLRTRYDPGKWATDPWRIRLERS